MPTLHNYYYYCYYRQLKLGKNRKQCNTHLILIDASWRLSDTIVAFCQTSNLHELTKMYIDRGEKEERLIDHKSDVNVSVHR